MLSADTLILQNPWWKSSRVPEVFLGKKREKFYRKIQKFLPLRQILLIYGLRRTGKTTFLYQLIQDLLNSGVDSRHILYFSFDEKVLNLKQLLNTYETYILKQPITEESRIYMFLDEIQKLSDWQDQVKLIYDRFPKIKIFLSGSASVNLQRNVRESLAGRVFEFEFPPLSFGEFLEWKKAKVGDLHKKELKLLAREYVLKGGFPEIIGEQSSEVIRMYLKSSVLYKILEQDLPAVFGLRDPEFLKALVEYLFSQPGSIINYDSLSSHFGRSKVTVLNYVFYLKYALLVREVRNFRPNLLLASRKGRKLYPYNPAFCFVYLPEDQFFKRALETAVAYALSAKYYYRNRFEVDFVLRKQNRLYPVEVKAGEPDVSQVAKFLKKFGGSKGYVVTEDYEEVRENIEILPLWKVMLEGVGAEFV